MKGRCLNRLTMEPLTPRAGLEPATPRLTAECSAIELSRNGYRNRYTRFFPRCQAKTADRSTVFESGEGGIKRALRALLPGSAKRRQEDGHAQHAFKARLSLTKALLKVKPVDDSTGFRERRRRDLKRTHVRKSSNSKEVWRCSFTCARFVQGKN